MSKLLLRKIENEEFCNLTLDSNNLHKQNYFYNLKTPTNSIAVGMRSFALSIIQDLEAQYFFKKSTKNIYIPFNTMVTVGEEIIFNSSIYNKNKSNLILSTTNSKNEELFQEKDSKLVLSSIFEEISNNQINNPNISNSTIYLPTNNKILESFASNIYSKNNNLSQFIFSMVYSSGALQELLKQNPKTSLEKELKDKIRKNILPAYKTLKFSLASGIQKIISGKDLEYQISLEKLNKREYLTNITCLQDRNKLFDAEYQIMMISEETILRKFKKEEKILNKLFS